MNIAGNEMEVKKLHYAFIFDNKKPLEALLSVSFEIIRSVHSMNFRKEKNCNFLMVRNIYECYGYGAHNGFKLRGK